MTDIKSNTPSFPDDEEQSRLYDHLEEVCSAFLQYLHAADTEEISINSDGRMYVKQVGLPKIFIGEMASRNAIILNNLVRNYHSIPYRPGEPFIETVFPLNNGRYSSSAAPYSQPGSKYPATGAGAPSMSIRCLPNKVFELEKYVSNKIMTEEMRLNIVEAIKQRRSITVTGGTGSGKTTLLNAILLAMAEITPDDRFVTIQDTNELRVFADDVVNLIALPPITMSMAAKHTLRRSPKRFVFGEIRGAEGYDVITSWATGHPGGALTLHAESAEEAPDRMLEACSMRGDIGDTRMLARRVARAMDIIIHIEDDPTHPKGRRVSQMSMVTGYDIHDLTFRTELLFSDEEHDRTPLSNNDALAGVIDHLEKLDPDMTIGEFIELQKTAGFSGYNQPLT